MGYIYINFGDLTPEKQNELTDCARDRLDMDELRQEAEDMNYDFDVLVQERTDRELYSLDCEFNI